MGGNGYLYHHDRQCVRSNSFYSDFFSLDLLSIRTFASSAPASAVIEIRKQFNVSAEISDLVTTVFLLGYVFGVKSFPQIFPFSFSKLLLASVLGSRKRTCWT